MNQELLELLQREDNISTYAISQLMESYEYLEGSTLPLYNKLQEMQLEKEISFEEEIERLVDIDFATYDHRHREPFTEAYEGKTKELLKIEKLIGEVMKICRKTNLKGVDPNKLPQTKLIAAQIKKMFGFRDVFFLWQISIRDDIFNPYTVHVTNDVGYDPNLSAKRPFYDSTGRSTIYIKLHTSLFMFHSLTPAHMTAILLTTIGTRFASTPWDAINATLLLMTDAASSSMSNDGYSYSSNNSGQMSLMKSAIEQSRSKKMANYTFAELIERFKSSPPVYFLMRIIHGILDRVGKTVEAIAAPVLSVVATVGGIAPFFLLSPIWAVGSAMTSSDMIYADQFTAHFGYGPELIEAIQILKYENTKFGYVKDEKDHGLNYLLDMTNAATEILANVGRFNTSEARAGYMIKRMEEDIKRMDLPENAKKPLRKELVRVKKAYEYYVLNMEHDPYSPFTVFVRKFIQRLNRGMNLGTMIFHKVADRSLEM